MSKKRHRSRRPKGQRHKRILNSVKEEIVQLKAMGMKINDIVDKTNIGYSTVQHICTVWAPNNPDRVKKARAKAFEELAERVTEKAIQALDHITPDSMTHDRVVTKNKDGVVTSVAHSGPNAPQLAVTAGVLIDKGLLLTDKAAVLRGETPDTLDPSNFEALLESIKGRVTRLTEVRADIDTGAINARIIELEGAEKPSEDEAVPADFTVVEE